jgi:hypothetical protein
VLRCCERTSAYAPAGDACGLLIPHCTTNMYQSAQINMTTRYTAAQPVHAREEPPVSQQPAEHSEGQPHRHEDRSLCSSPGMKRNACLIVQHSCVHADCRVTGMAPMAGEPTPCSPPQKPPRSSGGGGKRALNRRRRKWKRRSDSRQHRPPDGCTALHVTAHCAARRVLFFLTSLPLWHLALAFKGLGAFDARAASRKRRVKGEKE